MSESIIEIFSDNLNGWVSLSLLQLDEILKEFYNENKQ
jgi:hypothetical protein